MKNNKKMTDYSRLRKEIEQAINKNSLENGSNTPDFILAEYLTDCLRTFDKAVNKREEWHHTPLQVKERSIAVISLNTRDFNLWKLGGKLKGEGLETKRKFKIGHKTYYCIYKVSDLCGLAIDEIFETNRAKENKRYSEIIDNIIF